MEVILTGGTGFVGKNLEAYLNKNKIQVRLLSLRDTKWYEYYDSFDSDAIIHLAGKAHDTSNSSNPEEYFIVNRDLTIKLFDVFLRSNVKDFFFFSSVKAVVDTIDGNLTEDFLSKPLTPYGKSKFEAERYLLSKNLPIGKRLFIIRPCMIHGPGNKGNLNLLYNIVRKNIPWPLGAFVNKRSFLSIDNLSFLIMEMLKKSDLKSGIYNFSDDFPLSTNELVSLISKSLGKKRRIWKINKKIVEKFAQIGDFLSLPLNSERLKKLTESYVVSNQKIKSNLGIKELPLSVEEGLEITIKSFNNEEF
ncbi:NAD-dependent epimerase/dehydratase family protein [Sphingobacterium sp. WM]|uniref:NAD-dependent epimerase/dehydratase family protein n=1 Tax=Sphingobacterium sp. WM TaxID=3031802 RepID=UPI00240DF4CD|nr:NAD-dependent epimerase/dehydratase family protein [Sphingobacterium sp. WM]WFB63279.1 NAD-dependent epimerase/dehydratase family protein [Sphingobacterium sp. WM]